jgi:hypothetical protein
MPETQIEELRKAIIDVAVEAWRFRNVFDKAMSKLDSSEGSKYYSQFNWFYRKVELSLQMAGMRTVDVTGQLYDIGMAVTPLNLDDFPADEILYIEQMVEPIILDDHGIVRTGTVMLGRQGT